ncbi:choice-of-anchor D domain-containing protein [Neolewinella lacunae]|uniref:Choice-of-anchor D domain-containing protein n=1 Tax=Neolewinella lacunae TaxID=1517758 RepID=A0A923PIQ8_9BACT|nr:ELWxxDGT repeat protein [Neolewinella lacunae]MBC6994815.1 choice-of-anchor D domain-containing protein [Neolewinella lacunae]MDN3634437.1 choice-of-anchor D domain-containing protein [Neolewinella lacunae]
MKQLFTLFSLFLASASLWAQPVLVKDINPGTENASPTRFFPYGDRLLFRANDGQTGVELWITDGTEAGTNLIQDINLGDTVSQGNANPDNFIIYNDRVYFKARSASFGDELFVTDGESAGLIKDIQEGSGNANPFDMVLLNDRFYFTANDGVNSSELWSSDGTTEGTNLVVDIRPGNAGNPINKTIFGNQIVFTGNDGANGSEVWITDGTAEGTRMIKDIRPGSANSLPSQFFVFNDEVYFRANDGSNGTELWKSDGTEEGTVLVKDIRPGSGNSSPGDFFVAGGKLCFVADDGVAGSEIWTTDGTEAGTTLLTDLNPNGSSDPSDFLVLLDGQFVLFAADNGASGKELFSLLIDGEDFDVELSADLEPGAGSSNPRDFVFTGAAVYFSAETTEAGRELYEFEVIGESPERVSDIFPGEGSSNINSLTRVGRDLYFAATDTVVGTELYTFPAKTAEMVFRLEGNTIQPGDTIDLGTVLVGVDELIDTILVLSNVGTGAALVFDDNVGELSSPFAGNFIGLIFGIIPADDNAALVLDFAPTTAGSFLDSFYLDIPVLEGEFRSVFYVKGVGELPVPDATFSIAGNAVVSGTMLDFGELSLRQDSTVDVTITNNGQIALALDTITLSATDHFSLGVSEQPAAIAVGESFTFTVTYAPAEVGAHTGTVTIVNAASEAPGFIINLAGAATPSSINEFGIQASRAFPNPADQFFWVELAESLPRASYRLLDIQGRVVQQGQWPAGADRHRFDLSGVVRGQYYLEVLAGEKRLVVELVKR